MNKAKYLAIFIISIILLIGCSKNPITSNYNDDKKISSSSNTYSVEFDTQTVNGTELKGVMKKMEGMDTIWNYDSEKDLDINITYMLNVTSGKVKLVLIYPDNSVETIIEATKDSPITDYSTSTLHVKKGANRMKIVADENTSFEFNINIPKGKLKELGK